jgi:hypothetical protein
MPKEVDEDLIEATIRRVAEQAGRPADEATDAPADAAEAVGTASGADEDLIEATIRRVAESKAARAADVPIEMPVSEAVAPTFAKDEEEPGRAVPPDAPPKQASLAQLMNSQPDKRAASPPRLSSRGAALAAPAPAWDPASALDGEVISEQLREITQRLDAILPLLERIAHGEVREPMGEWERPSAPAPITMPQRPAIVRENSGASNSDVIDTRPLPEPLPPLVEPKRGFDLLPRTYRITVEDKRRGVDLVPLHRAMLGMEGVRDMSLLSYTNGTAIVALETQDELDPESVRLAMQNAMKRDARVEVHNEHTMVVKLTPED